jgi:Flp pilus assembly protein TadG
MMKHFALSTSGAFAAMTALLFPVLLGVAGLGIELGFWYTVKRAMQGAADSAVYEAALTYIAPGGQAVYVAHAQAVAGQNGWQDGVGGVTVAVNKPPQAGNHAGNNNAIEVLISRAQTPFMAWAVGYTQQATVAAHAVVLLTPKPGNDCVLALNTGAGAITFNGNGKNGSSKITASNCGVASDGSISFSGNSVQLTAKSVSVGTNSFNACPGSQCVITSSPAQVSTGTTIADPYASRSFTTPPATPGAPKPCPVFNAPNTKIFCGGTIDGSVNGGKLGFASDTQFVGALSVSGGTTTFGGDSAGNCSASPNVLYFIGGLNVSGQATVKLCPGIIYIEGGTFSVQGANPTVTGTGGVTIILTANPSAASPSYATADVAGNGTVTLTAPSGDTTITLPDGSSAIEKTAGLVFFQDPKAPTSSTTGISFSGNGTTTLTGAIYSPTETVTIAGNGISGNATTCTQVVSQFVVVSGNGSFQNGCVGDGTANFGSGNTAQLVE